MKFRVSAVIIMLLLTLSYRMRGQDAPSVLSPPQAGTIAQAAQNPTEASATDKSELGVPTFKVDVKLVNVFVTVLDQNGAPVTTLKKNDFKVFEDGEPQTIAVFHRESQLPLSIVLAVDTSLSTRKDLPLELVSARRFAHSIVRPIDRLAVYEFSEVVSEVVPFTSDLKLIDRGISRIKLGAATAMYDAIYLGAEALRKREGRKVMVIITDGGDTVSSVSYGEALRAAQQSEAIVYSIVVVPIAADAGRDLGGEHALVQLSHDTGGRHYYAESIAKLDEAFRQISDELRTQYLLAYYPVQRLANSDFRRIEVRVRTEKSAADALSIRYRSGYYTSKFK
jgi:Ca-activated chloride channel family protein